METPEKIAFAYGLAYLIFALSWALYAVVMLYRTWFPPHRHTFYLEDLRRVSDHEVVCPCNTCGKVLTAPFGLALPGSFVPKPGDRRKEGT